MRLHSILAALLWCAATTTRLDAQETADTTAAAPVTRAEIQGMIDGLNEQLQALQADNDKLKRFKFSGYIQARIEVGEASSDSVKVSGAPAVIAAANLTRAFIRRARLKLTYDASPLSQAVISVDGSQDRIVRMLDAYITLLDPWTPQHTHHLTVGQFSVPFGFEIERSSSVRELPERSRAVNVLFSGERDRGAKLESQWTDRLRTTLAVLNGGGANNADFPTTDPTRGKDVLARARWSQGAWDAAASVYHGSAVTPLTGGDIATRKTRFGGDAQAFFTVPGVGGATIRGEFYTGREINVDSLRVLVVAPTSANPVRLLRTGADPGHLATHMLGGYAMWVQNAGDALQFVARWEMYDPNTGVAHDAFRRFGAGVNWYFDGFTRVTAAYDVPWTHLARAGGGHSDPHDNLWTLQVQHKF